MKGLLMVLGFMVTINSSAQESDIGNWFIYFGNQKLNPKWNWHNEIQYRNYNYIGDLQQLLLRTGIGYNLSENNHNVLLGYGFVHSRIYIKDTVATLKNNEHRIFEQYLFRQNLDRVYLQHRLRLEERFFSNDFQMRFRYLIGINIPLNNKTMTDRTIYFSAYNEFFINGQETFFDRNRLYGAMGFVINKNFKVEAGFMAQTLQNTNRNQFQIVFFNNIPFSNN